MEKKERMNGMEKTWAVSYDELCVETERMIFEVYSFLNVPAEAGGGRGAGPLTGPITEGKNHEEQ